MCVYRCCEWLGAANGAVEPTTYCEIILRLATLLEKNVSCRLQLNGTYSFTITVLYCKFVEFIANRIYSYI